MGGEWRQATLGDVIELKRGYDLPSGLRQNGRVPIISSSGESGKHNAAMVKGPGVITGRYGTIGKVFYTDHDFWPLNTTLYVRDFKGANPRFVSYFLQTLDFLAFSDKAAVPGVNRNHLHGAVVLWPSATEQRAIADLLGALDDKIELNRRMAETIEATAQALFKSWFVDFDPVRAKAKGRSTSLPDDLAALFPAHLADDGVPDGWNSGKLCDLLELAYGKSLPSDARRLGAVPVYGSGGRSGFHDEALVQGPGIVLGRKGSVGALHWTDDNFYPIDTVFYVKPKIVGLAYLWRLLPLLGLSDMNTDAAVPGLNRNNAYRLSVLLPSAPVIDAFEKIAAELDKRRAKITEQCRTLAALRDALLPKLISGELRIRDAERAVAAA